ncbi:MAG: hypothetical protein NVV59_15605 [Chitinophagaceae bacterium]|nr:hypothetical protein [Chitinophagaceae bacterium]
MRNYFQTELNIPVYYEPHEFERQGKKMWIGHGDGLGPGDHGYKRLKKVFRNPACKWMFGILPPVVGMGIANYMSRRSRAQTGSTEEVFLGDDKEWLLIYCREMMQKHQYDYYIFGHRHLPIDYNLENKSRYINLGDWIRFSTYAVMENGNIELRSYTGQDQSIIRKINEKNCKRHIVFFPAVEHLRTKRQQFQV